MEKKNVGLIATVVTALLCGCPGLFGLCLGASFALVSQDSGADINVFGSNDPKNALILGIATLCLSVIFVAIPIVVGVFTLRKKPPVPTSLDEPIPPAI
jgi:hypothetical protein